MSVSLGIEWSDGRYDVVPIAGQTTATEDWSSIAQQEGLFWIQRFHNWVPITPENLKDIIRELRVFRHAILRSKLLNKDLIIENTDRLSDWLSKLKESTGWRASIG